MWPTLLSLLSLGFCVSLRIWAAVDQYGKPSLSAWPSPVVPLGQNVTLRCHFHSPLKRFRLFKTDGTSLSKLRGIHFNTFTLGPVTREHAGSYTCSEFSRFLPLLPRQSDPLQIVVTGVFTKPAISAHPGPLVQEGRNVTLRCQSPLLFDKFILHQENSTGHFQRHRETLTSGHAPADFSIGPMTSGSAGTYRCYSSLSRSPYEWSAPSDPVDIVITGFCVSLRIWAAVGEYDKPSLSAWPSPLVPLGQSVTLRCHSSSPFTVFRLFKRDGTSLSKLREHQLNTFTLGPVTREHAGSYTCSGAYTSRSVWSTHSDPLQIVVTGVFTKPDISAHPGPIVRAGENVTIRCHSPLLLDKFMLHKKGSNGHFQRRGETFTGRRAPADFSVGPMTLASAGTYRCYGSLSRSPYEWSAPSDPVDIVITGLSKKPSLSAQGGPVVRSGENVTLLCSSESTFDQFHLLREGENLGRLLAGGRGPRGALQAEFPLGPGTPAHSGAYRCYGSFTRSPYAWSDPSDPLLLSVTGFCVSLRIWAAVGEYEKPSLSAWPSPVVPLGQTVTLRCHSCSPFAIFRLFKRDGTSLPELQGHHVNTFTLGPVTREHAGSYTCSGFYWSLSVWSTHSDPLQIVVTGVFTKPAISAHPGPLVQEERNVTLRCHSQLLFDKYILHQENSTGHFQRRGETLPGGHAAADFFIGPMTSGSAGTYRCYGSLSRSPYEWSAPSDPVDIVITGLSKKPSLTAQGGAVVRSGENVTLLCSSKSAFNSSTCSGRGRTLGACSLEGGAPVEHSRQRSLWVLGPQPTAGPTGATAPSLALPTCGKTPVTPCSCVSQDPLQLLTHQPWIHTPQKQKQGFLKNTPARGTLSLGLP
ncbi:LOW QUALITY PROTEIN: immunoglobulin superfamily member 1-like [Cervus elaphus]|uniref:LOW QUALITY PROTEIN: immunoglobulin superfamily member 1-like n=1 Tax=Cervus elaphus TaxID=9860 RepID=UPI001CC303B2|nr:LOW QUALITY PROTEIN: immunoglobulin superfamily member 1-like [Cervus elaphus]